MKTPKRIVIAEDHALLREGLCSLLAEDPELEIVGKASDGREAVAVVEKLQPDLVLMDLSMPRMSGMDAMREIARKLPRTKFIVLTQHDTEIHILEALRAGAHGYVLKDCAEGELNMAIKSVLAGKPYLSPDVSHQVIAGFVDGKRSDTKATPWDTLSTREKEILSMVAEGRRTNEIADRLCISAKTVQKHRANLMKKLDLHSIAALTSFAVKKGLLA